MSRNWLLIFFILFETLQTLCSGEESFNPFGPQLNKESGLKNAELSMDKEFNYESNEVPSDEKIIEKRRLFFKEDDLNSPVTTDGHPESNEYSERRKTNYSESENEQMPDFQQRNTNWDSERNNWDSGRNTNWDNERNRFSVAAQEENFRNGEDIRSRPLFVGQPNLNQRYNWERRGNSFGSSQSRWNEDINFKSFENSGPNMRMGNYYNGRTPTVFNNKEMNAFSEDGTQDFFNKKVPLTLKNREMENVKTYNERPGNMHSGCMGSDINSCNRNPSGLWSSHFKQPERGVIINFNTDCPKATLLPGNQLLHKFILTPTTNVGSPPERDLISSPRISPTYWNW